MILERQYFAVFYFRDLNRQLSKKGNKFRDSSVLNFILCFKKMKLFYISDKLKQAYEDEKTDDGSTPYAKSLQINLILQQKIQNGTYQ